MMEEFEKFWEKISSNLDVSIPELHSMKYIARLGYEAGRYDIARKLMDIVRDEAQARSSEE